MVTLLRALYVLSALAVRKRSMSPGTHTHCVRGITPEAANLFGVIVSSEQKRQTSTLKSCSAWVGRGILTISPMNLVPSASKHECYQYLLHNTHVSHSEGSLFSLVSDNILLSDQNPNRSFATITWICFRSVSSFSWKAFITNHIICVTGRRGVRYLQ